MLKSAAPKDTEVNASTTAADSDPKPSRSVEFGQIVILRRKQIDEKDHTEALHKTRHAHHGVPCGSRAGRWLVRYDEEHGDAERVSSRSRERRIRDDCKR